MRPGEVPLPHAEVRTPPHHAGTGAAEPIAALNRVRILEYAHGWQAREPLVDIRIDCPEVVCAEAICPYLRRTAANMLNAAQASLPAGHRLKVGTALRTLHMQRTGWDAYIERMRVEHPTWPLSALRRATNKYFAPYDQKAPPGHCTGGAVDVGVLDPSGASMDMVAPTQGWAGAETWSAKISPEARSNRMMMVEAMLEAGFSNCRDEYWHYSWGDSAWAVRTGQRECPYGWAHPPIVIETDFPGARVEERSVETVRDMNGRALRGIARCGAAVMSEATARLAAGLYWANGVPVELEVDWTGGPEELLGAGAGKEEWEILEARAREGARTHYTLVPRADRVVLSSRAVGD